MRAIRLFYRLMNYTSTPKDRVKCEHSLAHSLRISPPTGGKKTKRLEWNAELADKNLMCTGLDIKPLTEWSEQERLELLYRLAPLPKIRNQSKLQEQLRQYRLKMKKAIISEKKKGNTEAAEFMDNILNSEKFVPYERVQQLAKLPIQRKNQRLKMLETYLNAYNQLRDRPNANHVFLQEGIFKVPHRWEVGTDIISLEEYMLFTRQFLEHYFPEYPIKLIIGHDDERSVDDNTGAHTHYFISGQNEKTGKYDFRKAQIKVVNEYIRLNAPNEKQLSEDGNLTRQQNSMLGHYCQRIMLDFANENLFKSKGLKAEFAPETEQKSALRKKMNAEAKLPKSERSHNYYTHQLERTQQKIQEAEHQYNELIERTNYLDTQNHQLFDDIVQARMRLSELIDLQEHFMSEVAGLKDKLSQLSQLNQALTDSTTEKLVSIFRQLLVATLAHDKNTAKKQAEYLEGAFVAALELPPALARGISASISKQVTALSDEAAPQHESEHSIDK